jgi:tRNA (cmo5U34)-methyltransferase
MLALATRTLGPLVARVSLYEGYVDSAPEGPFDGAACLLTLHFVAKEERLRTLIELRERLNPGAPLVVAHHSFQQAENEQAIWLDRYAAFAAASGVPLEKARNAAQFVLRRIHISGLGRLQPVVI